MRIYLHLIIRLLPLVINSPVQKLMFEELFWRTTSGLVLGVKGDRPENFQLVLEKNDGQSSLGDDEGNLEETTPLFFKLYELQKNLFFKEGFTVSTGQTGAQLWMGKGAPKPNQDELTNR